MFYFPLITTTLPDWLPFWGGDYFVFFSPVFNFADAAISVGVVALALFCRKELAELNSENNDNVGNNDNNDTAVNNENIESDKVNA